MSPTRDADGTLIALESERISEQHQLEDAEIETLLAGFCGKGFMVTITRQQPRWCQGFLDTWPLEEGGISMADIKAEFGGRRFGLKIKRSDGSYVKTIPVWIDDEPKRDGRPIRLNSAEFADRSSPIFQNPPGSSAATSEILRYMQASNDRTLKLLGDMLTTQKNGPTGPPPDLAAQLASMGAMMDLLGSFQERFGGGGGGEGGNGMAQMFTELMAKKFLGDSAAAPQKAAPPPKRLPQRRGPPQPLAPEYAPPIYSPPVYSPPQQQNAPPTANPGTPPPQPQPQIAQPMEPEDYEPNEDDTAADLIDLGPEAAGRAIAAYLNGVDEPTAKATIQALFNQPVDLDRLQKMAVGLTDEPGGTSNQS